MSAGAFTRTKYEADNGDIYAVRVQPETLAATFGGTANAAPTGAVDQEGLARIAGGNRRIGIKARSVTVTWSGSPPTGYRDGQLIRVPILTLDLYNSITPNTTTGNYLGTGVIVVGKNAQRGR